MADDLGTQGSDICLGRGKVKRGYRAGGRGGWEQGAWVTGYGEGWRYAWPMLGKPIDAFSTHHMAIATLPDLRRISLVSCQLSSKHLRSAVLWQVTIG